MKVQVGDQYVYMGGGTGVKIITVTKVLITKDANGNFYEYVIFDNVEGHDAPVTFIMHSHSDTSKTSNPFTAVKNEYPDAKWIAKDDDGEVYACFERPRLGDVMWTSHWQPLSPEDFPEVYTYFADIPFDESLTAI